MDKNISSPRQCARQVAMQALYAWEITDNNIEEIIVDVLLERDTDIPMDTTLYQALVRQVVMHAGDVDASFEPYLSRSKKSITPIELAILRLSTSELMYDLNIPYRIVINEGIELAKAYGAQDSHKFINGILDKVSLAVRAAER